MTPCVLLSWSSGKDSAWALHILHQQADVTVAGLLATVNDTARRVMAHDVRLSLVEAQAAAVGLPLWSVPLPSPCSNTEYEDKLGAVFNRARERGITHVAFGDLYLEDVRDYRMRMVSACGLEPLFPLWCAPADTPRLARTMLRGGLQAVLTCVDPQQLPHDFVGRQYDRALLDDLPDGVDPCGERGEFHTFCWGGPMFRTHVPIEIGEVRTRNGFSYADLKPGVSPA